jgi:TolA-binding protein
MENSAYIDHIHRYLANAMTPQERTDFELKMEADAAFRHDVEVERALLTGIQSAGDKHLKHSIQTAGQRLKQRGFFEEKKAVPHLSTTKIITMRRAISMAAAIAVLAAAAWWIFYRQPNSDTPDAAFAQYFQKESTQSKAILKNLESFGMAGAENTQDSLRNALTLYDEGKYDDACAAFDGFLVAHPANDTAQFYLAMSHLNASRYARAIEVLTPVMDNSQSAFQQSAKWYTGLCYLKVEDGIEQAKTLFATLAEDAEFADRQAAKGMLTLLK